MSSIEIKQLKDKIEKLTQELWALENEEEVEEEEITPCDRCPCSDISWCWSNGCDKGKRRIEWLEEEEKCWTCDVSVATHKTYRDALGEFELTCDKCHREEYEEEEEEEEICCVGCGDYMPGVDKEDYEEGCNQICNLCDPDSEEEEEELTWQEKMKNYEMLVDACLPLSRTKDEDLVVGDIVKHSFGCRDYKLMRVDRLTEKTIWYSECWTEKHTIRDSGGNTHTYGKFLGGDLVLGLNYKRKRHTKVLSPGDEKWRGQMVYKYPSCGNIWIKEEESDIWR